MADSLPDVRVTEVIDESWLEKRGIAARDSFAIVRVELIRGQARILRGQRLVVVLQVAANKQGVISVGSDLVIQLKDISVVLHWIITGERERS